MAWHVVIPHKLLLLIVLMTAFLLVSGFVYAYLPQATIVVTPAVYEKTATAEITLSDAAGEPDFVRYILPAGVVESRGSETKTIQREGGEQLTDFARGIVTLHNEQDQEQPLLPKTHLRHEATGTFFLTDSSVTIPPQGAVTVAVTAKEEGASGDVGPGRFVVDKLPASLQDTVYGESGQPMSGGVSIENPLTEEELAAVKESALETVRNKIKTDLAKQAGGNLSAQLVHIRDENVTSTAEAGSRALSFTVHAEAVGRAFIVNDNDLLGLTVLRLREEVTAEEELITYDPSSFSVDFSRADFARGEALVTASLTGTFANKIGPTLFAAEGLAGLQEPEVRERLREIPGVGEVEVSFSPFWVTAVPAQPGSVEIRIEGLQK